MTLSGSPGTSFDASLMINNAVGMNSGDVLIQFDPQVLSVTEVDPGLLIAADLFALSVGGNICPPGVCPVPVPPPLPPMDLNDPSSGQVAFLLNNSIDGTGDILGVMFQVVPGATPGPTSIGFALDYNGGPQAGPGSGGLRTVAGPQSVIVSATVPEPGTAWLLSLILLMFFAAQGRRVAGAHRAHRQGAVP